MTDSYFGRIEESESAGLYLASPATAGPWSEQLQHGGPPNALAVAAAERVVRLQTGRDDLVALRLACDFLRPVPVGTVATRARVVRAARSAVLAEVTVAAAGRDCLHVRVWFVRAVDTSSLAPVPNAPVPVPAAHRPLDAQFGYGTSVDWRFLHGGMRTDGPGAAWVRPLVPLVDDQEAVGLARAVLVADSAGGISSELDWSAWSFANVDLDVHLARPLEGEWVLLDAVTQLGPQGSALARSTLSDRRGIVGAGLQTLLLAPARHG